MNYDIGVRYGGKLNNIKEEMADRDKGAVKGIVLDTLESIDRLEAMRDSTQESIKFLKNDLKDFKDGRLDRLDERHKLSDEARKASVIEVVKEKVVSGGGINHWYENYVIIVKSGDQEESSKRHVLNNSLFKLNTCGTYKSKSGKVLYV
jgi:hypothetical protein